MPTTPLSTTVHKGLLLYPLEENVKEKAFKQGRCMILLILFEVVMVMVVNSNYR